MGTFSDATVEDATWTAPGTTARNQVVTLTLTVTDSDGDTASASVTITVPSGPTVSIQTEDQTVFGGDSIDLLATARDSDGSDLGSYTWTDNRRSPGRNVRSCRGERRRCDLDGAGCNGGHSRWSP